MKALFRIFAIWIARIGLVFLVVTILIILLLVAMEIVWLYYPNDVELSYIARFIFTAVPCFVFGRMIGLRSMPAEKITDSYVTSPAVQLEGFRIWARILIPILVFVAAALGFSYFYRGLQGLHRMEDVLSQTAGYVYSVLLIGVIAWCSGALTKRYT